MPLNEGQKIKLLFWEGLAALVILGAVLWWLCA